MRISENSRDLYSSLLDYSPRDHKSDSTYHALTDSESVSDQIDQISISDENEDYLAGNVAESDESDDYLASSTRFGSLWK